MGLVVAAAFSVAGCHQAPPTPLAGSAGKVSGGERPAHTRGGPSSGGSGVDAAPAANNDAGASAVSGRTRQPSGGPGGPAEAISSPQLEVRVADAVDDREGAEQTPPFIEIEEARVAASGRSLAMSISTMAAVPSTSTGDEDVVIFAFDIDAPAKSFSLVAQLTSEGWRAELRDDSQSIDDARLRIAGDTLHLTFPWSVLGENRPRFSWTAATSVLRFEGTSATAMGGDSAPATPSSFPATTSEEVGRS